MTPNMRNREGTHGGSITPERKTAAILKQYEDRLNVRYAEKTAKDYLTTIRQYLAWLDARGVSLTKVTTADLLAYQTDVAAARKPNGAPYPAEYQMKHVTVLKALYTFLVRRGYMLANPTGLMEYPKIASRLPRSILSKEEMRRILDTPDRKTPLGLRDRAILETFYATGIRAGELANLRLNEVDTEDRLLRVVLGKGRKDRNVPLTRAAAEAIEEYLLRGRPRLRGAKASPLLFIALRGGRMLHDTLGTLVKLHTQRAGIEKPVTCHTFRHCVATHLLKGGADIRHIQKLLGHTSLATTERYTRVEISDLKEVLRRAHPRGR